MITFEEHDTYEIRHSTPNSKIEVSSRPKLDKQISGGAVTLETSTREEAFYESDSISVSSFSNQDQEENARQEKGNVEETVDSPKDYSSLEDDDDDSDDDRAVPDDDEGDADEGDADDDSDDDRAVRDDGVGDNDDRAVLDDGVGDEENETRSLPRNHVHASNAVATRTVVERRANILEKRRLLAKAYDDEEMNEGSKANDSGYDNQLQLLLDGVDALDKTREPDESSLARLEKAADGIETLGNEHCRPSMPPPPSSSSTILSIQATVAELTSNFILPNSSLDANLGNEESEKTAEAKTASATELYATHDVMCHSSTGFFNAPRPISYRTDSCNEPGKTSSPKATTKVVDESERLPDAGKNAKRPMSEENRSERTRLESRRKKSRSVTPETQKTSNNDKRFSSSPETRGTSNPGTRVSEDTVERNERVRQWVTTTTTTPPPTSTRASREEDESTSGVRGRLLGSRVNQARFFDRQRRNALGKLRDSQKLASAYLVKSIEGYQCLADVKSLLRKESQQTEDAEARPLSKETIDRIKTLVTQEATLRRYERFNATLLATNDKNCDGVTEVDEMEKLHATQIYNNALFSGVCFSNGGRTRDVTKNDVLSTVKKLKRQSSTSSDNSTAVANAKTEAIRHVYSSKMRTYNRWIAVVKLISYVVNGGTKTGVADDDPDSAFIKTRATAPLVNIFSALASLIRNGLLRRLQNEKASLSERVCEVMVGAGIPLVAVEWDKTFRSSRYYSSALARSINAFSKINSHTAVVAIRQMETAWEQFSSSFGEPDLGSRQPVLPSSPPLTSNLGWDRILDIAGENNSA